MKVVERKRGVVEKEEAKKGNQANLQHLGPFTLTKKCWGDLTAPKFDSATPWPYFYDSHCWNL